jgi:hypothetical protein
MQTVQLALGNTLYGAVVLDLLAQSENCLARRVDRPDPGQAGVLVLNSDSLEYLPLPLKDPERVVLVTHNDPAHLARAWEAGIRSVVFETDPPRTMVLAILGAMLRVRSPRPELPGAHITHPSRQPAAKALKIN